MRTLEAEVRDLIEARACTTIVAAIARAYGAEARLDYAATIP